MKLLIKRTLLLFLTFLMSLPFFLLTGCDYNENSSTNDLDKVGEFHTAVVQSQEYLDEIADDIYRYWYDAIYEDKYGGNITLAVYYAKQANAENLEAVETNEANIRELYKEVRDSELSTKIKAVMSAYTDYYEFVVNVSGSFQTYKNGKETYKKALASALKDLALEL